MQNKKIQTSVQATTPATKLKGKKASDDSVNEQPVINKEIVRVEVVKLQQSTRLPLSLIRRAMEIMDENVIGTYEFKSAGLLEILEVALTINALYCRLVIEYSNLNEYKCEILYL